MYLFDTHTLLWMSHRPEALPPRVQRIIFEGEFSASVVSYWELTDLSFSRRPPVDNPETWWRRYVMAHDIPVISLEPDHITAEGRLPQHHRDPFDRMLVAQAQVEKLVMVTRDSAVAKYVVRTAWR